MPTFCRHNRFIERCPICSKTLADHTPAAGRSSRSPRSARAAGGARRASASGHARPPAGGLRVQREGRAEDDGYRSELVPGLRASADASRLAHELAFASGRLLALAAAPPGLYGQARALAADDLELATWTCLLIAYLCPLEPPQAPDQGYDPFAGIRLALEGRAPAGGEDGAPARAGGGDGARAGARGLPDLDQLPDLAEIPLGPRSSHEPDRGAETLVAYRKWVDRAGPGQAAAFTGDPAWTPERRFERLFERLALPGFSRAGRYELLLALGRLGLYEMRPDSLHLGRVRGVSEEDQTIVAAKRVFGIGDPLLLERRAGARAAASSVPLEALDLALANWAGTRRATLGFGPETSDPEALARAGEALGV